MNVISVSECPKKFTDIDQCPERVLGIIYIMSRKNRLVLPAKLALLGFPLFREIQNKSYLKKIFSQTLNQTVTSITNFLAFTASINIRLLYLVGILNLSVNYD